MKKTIICSFLLMLLAWACEKTVHDDAFSSRWPQMADVFAEEETSHDSALVMAAFRHYDSLMPGRDYSRREKYLSFQKARAYYFKAIVEEYDSQRYLDAFSDYLNALWIVEGLKGERSVFAFSDNNAEYQHFTALLYGRLAWFLYTHDAWNMSLECLEKSSECFKGENNDKGVATNLELMGCCWRKVTR